MAWTFGQPWTPVYQDAPALRPVRSGGMFGGSISAPKRSLTQRVTDAIADKVRPVAGNRMADKVAGLFEMTPAAGLTGAYDAGDDLRQGNYAGAAGNAASGALAMLGAIPAGSAVGKVASNPEVRATLAQMLADESGTLRLWHGSPHKFDRFSLDKIGTGEGAQAYGHGLYFAENKGVADEYRRALAEPEHYVGGEPFDRTNPIHWAAKEMHFAGGDANAAKRKLIQQAEYEREMLKAHALTGEYADERLPDTLLGAAIDLHHLGGKVPQFENRAGHLYEVNVDANPEDFLNWDAPLKGQAVAPKVSALQETAGTFDQNLDGAQAVNYLQQVERLSHLPRGTSSDWMRQAGIPGIRYLDQGSRGVGNGTHNYVVFDPSIIDILNRH